MNTTSLTRWKEAATLILAAGRQLVAGSQSSGSLQKAASASPLADRSCAVSHLLHSSFDYEVLLLKRSGKSRFMPSAYVFPGGVVDASDFSSEWLDIFSSFKNVSDFGLRSVEQAPESRPPIFATNRMKLGSPIPGEVAFRICALRETFEESGVLLVLSKMEVGSLLESLKDRRYNDQAPPCQTNVLSSSDLTKWRALVNQNPSNFIRMCRELEVLPNIWALHEWSNWLTPAGKYGGKRFDTAFFICCLQEAPHTLQDQREIVHYQWSTPSEVLQSSQAQELWIPPPQFYEFSRLCRFPLLSDLHVFASQRAIKGCEHWLPVVFLKDDHYISLLPGDKLYPLDGSEDIQLDKPEEEPALHRIVVMSSNSLALQITIQPKYDHVLPVIIPPLSHDPQSQL
ncbi:nucleoside diphosphate-linked moiety X motif 19 [Solea solea]|uniref:nucleoside diphosphate-linked moiety X motif 19 n=1 Tax=Solea solea TaxID=90069 RepID=UPI00272B1DEB|nr:nucleoside diphosphate-linked moiety X motif 19 [Solea solea]